MNTHDVVTTGKAHPLTEGFCIAGGTSDETLSTLAGLPLHLRGVAEIVLDDCEPGETLERLIPAAATSFGESLTSGLYDSEPGSPEWTRAVGNMRSFLELADFVGGK